MRKCCKPGAGEREQPGPPPPAAGPPPAASQHPGIPQRAPPPAQHGPAAALRPPRLGASHRDLPATGHRAGVPATGTRRAHGRSGSADTLQPQHPFHAGRSPPGSGVRQPPGSLTEGEWLRSPRVGVGPGSAGTDPDGSPK